MPPENGNAPWQGRAGGGDERASESLPRLRASLAPPDNTPCDCNTSIALSWAEGLALLARSPDGDHADALAALRAIAHALDVCQRERAS
jgi:hypothetical protein